MKLLLEIHCKIIDMLQDELETRTQHFILSILCGCFAVDSLDGLNGSSSEQMRLRGA